MLDASALIGHTILTSVEINATAIAYSPPHHPTIVGDATSFSLYASLPDCSMLLLGAPCQPFSVHGTSDGESNPKGHLASLGPLVSYYLDCPRFIIESVLGFSQTFQSHNALANLRVVAWACGFNISFCESNLRKTWIQTRHRLIMAGANSPLPEQFSQPPGPELTLDLLPIIDWSSPISDFPTECWPTKVQLGWIHDPMRAPPGYPRMITRRSETGMQIMRRYGTFCPGPSAPYLSQVVLVPFEQVDASLPVTQVLVQHQIATYGCLVRFFTPSEAFLIAGILPHKGPTLLMWELAGNACCPLLIFEALLLVSPPEIGSNFPIRDLRHIWLHKLGISLPLTTQCLSFPSPVDVTILLRHNQVTVACRFQGSASVTAIRRRIALAFNPPPEDSELILDGERLTDGSSLIAYDLYGKVIRIV